MSRGSKPESRFSQAVSGDDSVMPDSLRELDRILEGFEMSVVGFADALGTEASAATPSGSVDFLFRLRKAAAAVSPRLATLPNTDGVQVRWFSDSIIMSSRLRDGDDLAAILRDLAFVQATFALNGIFLRGSVSRGYHHSSANIDYGPALIRAVALERSGGDAVRVVLDPAMQYEIRELIRNSDPKPPVVRDCGDGAYFLDFLSFYTLAARASFRRELDVKHNEVSDNERVRAKFTWLAAYFNWRTRPPSPVAFASSHEFEEL